jgi:hypothetical protein
LVASKVFAKPAVYL